MGKRKADSGVKAATAAYLAALRLEGAQKPLGSLAMVLAESLEAAPEYARARLAKELRDLLTDLEAQQVRDSELAERRAARARTGSWVADR